MPDPFRNNNEYSPTELLKICRVDAYLINLNQYITDILAIVLKSKNEEELKNKLLDLLKTLVDYNKPSIGMALEKIRAITGWQVGELKGGVDGIDALCYHLSGSLCSHGIEDLQKVLKRFEEYKK